MRVRCVLHHRASTAFFGDFLLISELIVSCCLYQVPKPQVQVQVQIPDLQVGVQVQVPMSQVQVQVQVPITPDQVHAKY